MKTEELRNCSPEELIGRVKQWKDSLFRLKFKNQTAETRDTSTLKKTRRDIARALTVLNEKQRQSPVDKPL